MITFEEAFDYVLKNASLLSPKKVKVIESVGMVLAEDVYSAIDMPPFNKSAMDGYAFIASDICDIPAELTCIGMVAAGSLFKGKVRKGECVKIMTGAPVPYGADSVVMVEETESSGEKVQIKEWVGKGQNIFKQGEDIEKKQKVVCKGTLLTIAHISLLAAVGRTFVKVYPKPKVAIFNTGNEIVPTGHKLNKTQIYNSNGPQLMSCLKSDYLDGTYLGIVADNHKEMKKAIGKGLKADILLISGGVSMGDFDLVPQLLQTAGVKQIFHRILVQPGRPLFFGKGNRGNLVFGIPGNPVSNFVAYLLFVRQACKKMMGYADCSLHFQEGYVAKAFSRRKGRKHFVPVTIVREKGQYFLTPLMSHGSADILTLSQSDGLLVLEPEESEVQKGEKRPFLAWKEIYG